jgi:hypothetical protein
MLLITRDDATHVGCAFDHVIESFRNDLYPGYKSSAGVDPALLDQFPLAEEAVHALGLVVWPMVEFEADDALAAAAARFQAEPAVEQVLVCSPDKDLAQLVSGSQVVCWDRRRDIRYDEQAVIEKYGVAPASIPDWLALVGDASDGYPGLPGWGAKSASAVLAGSTPRISRRHPAGLPPGAPAPGRSASHRKRESYRLLTLRCDVPIGRAWRIWRRAGAATAELCKEPDRDSAGADAQVD